MFKCEGCGLEHEIKFGSGRFCSRFCANRRIYDPKKKEEVYSKVSAKLKHKKPDYICPNCQKSFRPKKVIQQCCSRSCSTIFYNKNMSDEQKKKISKMNRDRILSRYEQGDMRIGWQNRSRFGSSYPEQYFEQVLTERNIEFSREVRIGRWFIDFVLINNIALEIDGRQHKDEDRKRRDEEKDEYLISNGWKVFRINWTNPKSKTSKKYLMDKLEELQLLLIEV